VNDLLTPLVDAYRSENRGTSLDTVALRSRVLASAARRPRSRSRRIAWLVPIAAVFVASASLAAVPAARSEVAHALTTLQAFISARMPPPSATPGARRAPNPAPAPRVPALSPTPDLPEPPPPAPEPEPARALAPLGAPVPEATSLAVRHHAVAASHTGSAGAPARNDSPLAEFPTAAPAASRRPVPPPSADLAPDLQAYSVAHDLHFAKADYARAIEAWSSYLARFPSGTFAPEARLNRAVCLARLGRTSEARAALTTIEIIEDEGEITLGRLRDELGLDRLGDLMQKHKLIGDVRGQGLVIGIELVTDRDSKAPAKEEAEAVMYRAMDAGLSFKTTFGNVLTLTPSLTLTKDEMGKAIDILDAAIGAVAREHARH